MLGKEADWNSENRYSCLLNHLLLRSPVGGTQISLCILPIQRGLTRYLFPKFLCHQFSNHVPSKFSFIQPNHWLQLMNQYTTAHLVIFSSEQKPTIRGTSQSSASWEDFSSPLSFRDVPGVFIGLKLSTFGWCLHIT